MQAFGVNNGQQTSSGLPVANLPQAQLIAQTRPVTNGTVVLLNAFRVNGAAVRPSLDQTSQTCGNLACPPGFLWNGLTCAGR